MILEQLISAYLDGDLTPEQDRTLRSQISSDPVAREAFDAAVLVNISLSCESEEHVPSDLREKVFAGLDKAHANEIRLQRSYGVKGRSPVRSIARATALVCAMLLMWLPIQDQGTGRRPQATAELHTPGSRPQATAEIHAPGSRPQATAELNTSGLGPQATAELPPAPLSAGEGRGGEFAGQQGSGREFAESSDVAENHMPPSIASVFSANGMNSRLNLPVYSAQQAEQPEPYKKPTEVVLSSSIAAGLGPASLGATDIKQVSASIGFATSDDEFMGFEVGSTSYSIQHNSSMLQPDGNYTRVAFPTSDTGRGKLSSPDAGAETYTQIQFSYIANQSTFWGSAFYERRVIALRSASLNARFGAGVSEDGVLGYGSLMGEWRFGKVVSIVAGTELRAMPFRVGAGSTPASATSYGAFVTGLTGVHVRF